MAHSTSGKPTPLQWGLEFTFQDAVAACTTRGRGETLMSNTPTEGRAAYVWRMARFHSGIDTHMPISACFRLADDLQAATGVKLNFAVLGDVEKLILKHLDEIVDRLILQLGLDGYRATQLWGASYRETLGDLDPDTGMPLISMKLDD